MQDLTKLSVKFSVRVFVLNYHFLGKEKESAVAPPDQSPFCAIYKIPETWLALLANDHATETADYPRSA